MEEEWRYRRGTEGVIWKRNGGGDIKEAWRG